MITSFNIFNEFPLLKESVSHNNLATFHIDVSDKNWLSLKKISDMALGKPVWRKYADFVSRVEYATRLSEYKWLGNLMIRSSEHKWI